MAESTIAQIGFQNRGTDPRIGQNVLHYQIVEEIGRGGMSVVYRAIAPDEREVAVKVLHPFLANKPDCRRRLAREAKTISKLDHPNILHIFDYSREIDFSQTLTPHAESGDAVPDLFIVTELVDGMTLKDFAERYQIWSVPEIGALIVREIALALHFAHSRGVIHRDIKPENVMIRSDGVLKLMDFGIAYVKDQESLTMTGTMLGSPAHMAPEIIEGKMSDFRSDIFSLSTVFYWLVSGELPYDGSNPHSLMRNIVEGRCKPIEEVSEKISDPLRLIIEKGMATAAEQRFQNVEELANAITKALSAIELNVSSTQLQIFLTNPSEHLDSISDQIHRSSLEIARRSFAANNFLLGTSCLNRILADEPEHKEALSLLERYQFMSAPPKKRSHRVNIALVSTSAIATAFFAVWMFHEEPAKKAPTIIAKVPLDKKSLVLEPTKKPEPPKAPIQTVAPAQIAKENPKPKVEWTPPKAIISVTPFADIWIDGKEVATNSSRLEIPLSLGVHSVVFKHEFAATEERSLTVNTESKDLRLHVDLERVKPASLTVNSNVDADISVEGAYKGTAKESTERPILIAFPKKTHGRRLEIVVSKRGYLPYIASHTVIAGKSQTIDVHLEPEPAQPRG